ncbi:uncharacterized protein LOC127659612 isoform X7 [Xyrauchen texanus]|uniref:uncharacterized protein LOC127659612 isoform X7 n=1 Tax=Xyrauchen texanus TaxID=154827 RepID=UPI002241922B|nr:uncharacterized protein LOC127659612 isoform X7 [Xyrauchen texanus]
MLFIFGLLLLLIPTHTCVDMFCRFNQTDPCYTSLGHKLNLQVVTDARDQELELHKELNSNNKIRVFRVKNNTIMNKHESISHRSEFIFNNGTLIINSVIRSDSGTYRLLVYDTDGRKTHEVDLQVNIEERTIATVTNSTQTSGHVLSVTLIVSGSTTLTFILLIIIVCYTYKKKKQLKLTAESSSTADVEKMDEEEVQYGEVTFTPTVSNIQQADIEHGDCVYSQVPKR